MNYKLIATDMDGTLLNDDIGISKRTIEALEKANEKGVKIVFATGRLHASTERYLNKFDFNIPVISGNGAIMTDGNKEIIFENTLRDETIIKATKIMDEMDIYYHIYTVDSVYAKDIDVEFLKRYYTDENGKLDIKTVEFNDVEEILNQDIKFTKILASDDDYDKLAILENKFIDELEGVEVTKSWVDNVEVMNKNVSKAVALEELCKREGIKPEEVIAIGDNENDIPMLEFAGKGIAMGNAVDLVKEKIDIKTDTNENDGLAKVIEKYVL